MNKSFLLCGLLHYLFILFSNVIILSPSLWIFYKLIFISPSETLHNKPMFLCKKQPINIWSCLLWYPKLKCPTPYFFYMLTTLTFFRYLPWDSFIQTVHLCDHSTIIKHKCVSVSFERERHVLERHRRDLFSSSYLKGYSEDFRAVKSWKN